MKQSTIQALLNINKTFYLQTQAFFDDSRAHKWDGWDEVAARTKLSDDVDTPLKILDLGCGNGRFASFLSQKINCSQIEYCGIDANAFLLDSAAKKTNDLSFSKITLIEADVLKLGDNEPAEILNLKFDCIVLFGVMHHVPSFALRSKLLRWCESRLAGGGKLIVTFWQFESKQELIMRSSTDKLPDEIKNDLEPNDYILDWQRGVQAERYCHLVTHDEQEKLLRATNLTLVAEFEADGKNHQSNRYLILEKRA